MTKKFISILAIVVMALCLISGGCTSLNTPDLQSWKELIKINPEEEAVDDKELSFDLGAEDDKETNTSEEEKIDVDLYFIGADGKKLALENRTIVKKEGLARSTIEELIKGPETPENLSVFPEGTRLLDINIKPDGRCIVDFSSQLTEISSEHQEKLAIYALVNTLGQFSSVQEVDILINGQKVDTIAGYVNVSAPIEPDYSI